MSMERAAHRPVLSFRSGGVHLAAAADAVREVLRMPAVTRVPHAPASLLGLANLRGVVAPIVSLNHLLGRKDGVDGDQGRVLVLDLDAPVGLAVDEVTSLGRREGDLQPGELFMDGDASVKVIDLVALLRKDFAGLARPHAERAASSTAAPSADQQTVEDTVGLVTFELAGQLYGLPLERVREVLRLPPGLAALPDSQDADLGVVPFRDRVLPLVSLRSLLGLAGEGPEGGRVLIVEIGEAAVGLVVDRLDAIVRAPLSTISAMPSVLNRGGGEARIQALVRLGEGRGLVSLLAPDRLFNDDATARLLDGGRVEQDEMTESTESELAAFVVFQLGAEEYGLPIASVAEVLKLPERLTRVPKMPAFVEGVMNLRGQVVPVIDQSRRFDSEGSEKAVRRVIITAVDGMRVGFIVDRVSEIVSLSPDQLRTAPQLPGQGAELFRQVAQVGDRLILLVDPKSLLDQAEADLLKAMTVKAPS